MNAANLATTDSDVAPASHSNGAVKNGGTPQEIQRGEGTSTSENRPKVAVTPAELLTQRGLSQRELEIVGLVAAGCANKEIGRRLSLTEATVKVHLKNILAKSGLSNRTQLAVWWVTNGERNFEVPDIVKGMSRLDGMHLLRQLIAIGAQDEVIFRALGHPTPSAMVRALLILVRELLPANPHSQAS